MGLALSKNKVDFKRKILFNKKILIITYLISTVFYNKLLQLSCRQLF